MLMKTHQLLRNTSNGIPTLIVFKDGQPVDKVVGFQPKENLAEVLDKHL